MLTIEERGMTTTISLNRTLSLRTKQWTVKDPQIELVGHTILCCCSG